ncbi:HEAT repeat domain-containing protein [Leptolyngbyaceae cyanobacterium CCMR0082]|uniref:HEAT repeat domain-containing protein n=2 Tax=Adonisia TaxID=2950183 RepID=A0A6M0S3W7_9CYAN|nr:HEAT repeat domain-containing protein [Adonisia turfae CCMR0082]
MPTSKKSMNFPQIQAFLDSPNPQLRMKAIAELHHHEPAAVVPLLKQRMNDGKFLVRSFVAMGLGYKRNNEAFEALISILNNETDHNVVAEASNSLAKFGAQALPHLIAAFEQNSNWLVRQSIFGALEDLDDPEVLLKLCRLGIQGEDLTVRMAALTQLRRLKETHKLSEALNLALASATDDNGLVRTSAARTLRHLGGPEAQAMLDKLQQDSDYRVVRAVLEGLL